MNSVKKPFGQKTYFIQTFGCQMNEHDSEKMAGMLEEKGYLTLDYDYPLEGYPYTEYRQSDLYAYFCRTIEEAKGRPGFLGDTPVLELGSIAPAE